MVPDNSWGRFPVFPRVHLFYSLGLVVGTVFSISDVAGAEEPEQPEGLLSVEQIVEMARPSLVIISVSGRDGRDVGVGTGFVIDSSGLIATNLHVIGDARQFRVELGDGRQLTVSGVHASDRNMDLAIIQVKEQDLPALKLGKLSELKQGAPIVVMGNPHGLKDSVVSGVNSGIREIDGRQMLQLAISIEPGNSGGPVMDRRGHVYGVVTMKSVVTENLGFAVDVATLTALLEKPNPVPIDRWLTIGVIDPRDWKTLFGARWQQRGGKLLAGGVGQGFAGRSLCLSTAELPEVPYEVAVRVRLDDEAGAAGLVFHSDGQYKHYGFYPTAGKLRLTLFEGPDVFSWKVLYDQPSEHYRPGQWNTLKVRIEKDRLSCYCNDELVVESTNQGPTSGQVGLAKFRDTRAEFRNFQLARKIPASRIAPQEAKRLEKMVDELPVFRELLPAQLDALASSSARSEEVIRNRIKRIEQQASELRRLANDIHSRNVCLEMGRLLKAADQQPGEGESPVHFDLLRASLLISILDGEDIDLEAYVAQVDRMAMDIRKAFAKKVTAVDRLEAMDKYLFKDNGFHGSRFDYYHRANSYMNRVISDREGLPISLSVLYMELGHRLELSIEGVGLPGHFVVRFVPGKGESQLIDVFDAAQRLTGEAASELAGLAGRPLPDELLAAVGHRAILTRMLNNLLNLAQRQDDKERMLRYLEMMMVVDPGSIQARGMRSIIRYETGRKSAAIADLDWFLKNKPAELDLERIRQMRDLFQQDRVPR